MLNTFNSIMKNCPTNLYGTLYIDRNIRGQNIVSFGFTLSYILSQLGTHYISSVKSKGYVYYCFRFGKKEYDLRDKQQFLKLRDSVKTAYNAWVEFYKNGKNKNE